MNPRRSILACALSLAGVTAGLAAGAVHAQTFPGKALTIIIGSSPGSTTDGLARMVGTELTKELGQPVIVDSRAGASGGIAAQAVARAAPDGHTLFMTTNTTQAANPHLFKKLAYDPVKDFAPVGLLAKGYQLLVVHPSVKAGSVQELVALAKKDPGKLSFGEGSSSARVATELFSQLAGIDLNHVPYKANPPAVIDLVSGQTQLMIVDLTTSLPQVKAGKLRALGVTSAKRSALAPEVPTLAESGLSGYEFGYWNALYAPAGTPAAVVRRLNEALQKAMAAEPVRRFVEQNGMEVVTSSPEELGRFQQTELDRWGRIIKTANIQAE